MDMYYSTAVLYQSTESTVRRKTMLVDWVNGFSVEYQQFIDMYDRGCQMDTI